MPNETLVIAPKSAGVSNFFVKDGDGVPIDFGVGTWSAHLDITRYPGDEESPLFSWTENDNLSFETGVVILTWDPDITYDFTRAHFDLFVKGPNVNSPQVRLDHGPVRIDF